MQLKKIEDPATGNIKYEFEITQKEMISVKFTDFDRAVLNGPEDSIADGLLKLEIIARRIEEAHWEPLKDMLGGAGVKLP